MSNYKDFIIEDTTLVRYVGKDTEVKVPSGVTEIGESAFLGNRRLKILTLQEGVRVVGRCAFSACVDLETINLPDTLENVGKKAFEFCIELPCIIFPRELKNLGDGACANCCNLDFVRLSKETNLDIGKVFTNCHPNFRLGYYTNLKESKWKKRIFA